jgi:hypothetical protein
LSFNLKSFKILWNDYTLKKIYTKKPSKRVIPLEDAWILGARNRNRTGTPAINEAADFKVMLQKKTA